MLTEDAVERARKRAWSPTAARVETLTTLSELFSAEGLDREGAIQGAASALSAGVEEAIVIYLLSEDGGWLLPVATHDPLPETHELLRGMLGGRFPADEGFTAVAIDRCSTILVPRVNAAELAALQPGLVEICAAMGMTGFVVAPLLVRGDCIGMIAQGRTTNTRALTDDDARFLEDVGRWLGIAIAAWPPGP
jgi:hypothetical protein